MLEKIKSLFNKDEKEEKVQKKVDDLGRVHIPTKMRRQLNICGDDLVNVYVKENKIIIEK